ncbi:PulJ/GspJ family protein [Microbacterium sp. A588]
MANRLTAPRRLDRRDEQGYTLVELLVAMGVFSVFLVLFISAIVSVSRASTQARVDAQTSSSVGIAMQRIERSVRYADSINYPGSNAGASYVEWRTDATSASSGVDTCTQLRYTAGDGKLAMRTWDAASSPSTGTWNVLVSDIRGESTNVYPFRTIAADGGTTTHYQGLTVHTLAGLSEAAGTETSATIYAKNSTVDSTSNAIGAAGQSMTPVCAGTDYRS